MRFPNLPSAATPAAKLPLPLLALITAVLLGLPAASVPADEAIQPPEPATAAGGSAGASATRVGSGKSAASAGGKALAETPDGQAKASTAPDAPSPPAPKETSDRDRMAAAGAAPETSPKSGAPELRAVDSASRSAPEAAPPGRRETEATEHSPVRGPEILPAPAEATAPAGESPPDAPAKIAPSETPTPRWVPLDVGNQWTYIYLRERERSVGGVEPQVESFRGTLVEEVVGNVPEYSPRAVEVHSTVRGQVEGSDTETVQKHRAFVESNGFSYQVLAIEAEDPVVGQIEFTRFTPPLLTLKAGANVGEKWRIGSKETAGLMTELEGEVLGVQDAKVPSGVFEKCLVVRYTGSFAGAIEVSGSRIEVQSGQIVTTEWYAPGVGKVLAKQEITESMVLADGSTLDYTERTQFALRSRKNGIQIERQGG